VVIGVDPSLRVAIPPLRVAPDYSECSLNRSTASCFEPSESDRDPE
jgi:hypothetical protein